MRAKDALGAYGEQVAVTHLTHVGLDVIERNWRCSWGELDVIAKEGHTLVFCEVKTRSSTAYGVPAEAIDEAKATRIRRLAARWIAERGIHAEKLRFDVVSVLRPAGRPTEIRHLRGAF